MGTKLDKSGKEKLDNEFNISTEEGPNGVRLYTFTPVEPNRGVPKEEQSFFHEDIHQLSTPDSIKYKNTPLDRLVGKELHDLNPESKIRYRCEYLYLGNCPTLQTLERLYKEAISRSTLKDNEMVEQLKDRFCNSGTSCRSCPTYEVLESRLPISVPELRYK